MYREGGLILGILAGVILRTTEFESHYSLVDGVPPLGTHAKVWFARGLYFCEKTSDPQITARLFGMNDILFIFDRRAIT